MREGYLKKIRIIIAAAMLCLLSFWPSFAEELVAKPARFKEIKNASGSKISEYSGRSAVWEGELKELVSNDAYFEYVLKLPSGDEIKVLSGKGLRAKFGDYVRVDGFIMIKEDKFSHLVATNVQIIPKPFKRINYLAKYSNYKINFSAYDQGTFNRILSWIHYYNPGISSTNARFIAGRIVQHSRTHKADPYLVTALISAESAFNISAISVAGAVGLGQLMPGTASALGVNPYDPDQNIYGAVRYLKLQLDRWSATKAPIAFALASYNAGPGAVEKFGGIPPYRETIDYVNIVSSLYYQICARK